MIPLTAREIATATGGVLVGDGTVSVRALTTDSRDVPEDALFVALRTERGDGHDHLAAAVAAGSRVLLVDHPATETAAAAVVVPDTWLALRALAEHVRRSVAPVAVAITGSVGKTTVKDLIAAAAGAGRRVHAARGTFNNELGVPLTVLGLAADDEVLVAEIGARHVGDIADLAPIVAPDIAVVTAVRAVHLEIFGSLEAIGRAKRELVESLGPGGLAVLNATDPVVAGMASVAPEALFVALDAGDAVRSPDVWAEDVQLDRRARPSATAVTPWGRTRLSLPIAGRHHVHNALLALAVAGHLGVDIDRAAQALADAPMSPWRGAVDEVGGVVLLDDAYNANPTAVAAALSTLIAIERTGRTVAVLGEMAEIGPTAWEEHLEIGKRCAELGVDRLVAVGAGAAAIAQGARQAGMAAVDEVPDAEAAADLLANELRDGDVVLVKASRVAGLERVAAALRVVLSADDERSSGPEARP